MFEHPGFPDAREVDASPPHLSDAVTRSSHTQLRGMPILAALSYGQGGDRPSDLGIDLDDVPIGIAEEQRAVSPGLIGDRLLDPDALLPELGGAFDHFRR